MYRLLFVPMIFMLAGCVVASDDILPPSSCAHDPDLDSSSTTRIRSENSNPAPVYGSRP